MGKAAFSLDSAVPEDKAGTSTVGQRERGGQKPEARGGGYSEHFPSKHEVLGSSQTQRHTPEIPTKRQKQADLKFKVIFNYIVYSRPSHTHGEEKDGRAVCEREKEDETKGDNGATIMQIL